tara:strand:- start:40 stop:405 length:366 start_codon:yes stop_codon:yes gene_type:complete
MKSELAFFLFELGLKSSKRFQREIGPGSMFTSYKHFGAPEPLSRMDRPFSSGYQTYPELSRPFWAPVVHTAATRVLPVAGAVTGAIAVNTVAGYAEAKAIQSIAENESVPTKHKIEWIRGY